jgi:hypothetical protein
VNGHELENWKNVNLYDLINQLGDAGWEIVGVNPAGPTGEGGGIDLNELFFKRPK